MSIDHTSCPLCGGKSKERFTPTDAAGQSWRIDECEKCSIKFLNPTLEGAELDPFYSDDYYGPGHHRFSGGAEGMIPVFRKARARRIKRLLPEGGSVLDVGCGRGVMLKLLKDDGYRCEGIERSESAGADARELGLEIHTENIENAGLMAESFDVVTFWQVLEHLENPAAAVRESWRILKPGGKLLLQVPDAGGLQAKIGGGAWFHLDPPRHLYNFTIKSLDMIAEKGGFKRENLTHLSIEYGPFGMLQTFMNLLGIKRELLFDLMMSQDKKALLPSPISRGALWLAAAILGPPSFALDVIASWMKAGSVLEAVYAKKN